MKPWKYSFHAIRTFQSSEEGEIYGSSGRCVGKR